MWGLREKKKQGKGRGLERKLTAGSLNVKEQRNYRNLIPMQLNKDDFPNVAQSSTGLVLKLEGNACL